MKSARRLKIERYASLGLVALSLTFAQGACDEETTKNAKKTLINDIPHTTIVNEIRKEVGDQGCAGIMRQIKRDNCFEGDTACRIAACQK